MKQPQGHDPCGVASSKIRDAALEICNTSAAGLNDAALTHGSVHLQFCFVELQVA